MTPCGCDDGDYRDECWNNCGPTGGPDGPYGPEDPREGSSCPAGSGTHWDAAQGGCVPDGTPGTGTPTGGGECPPGEGILYPGGPCVGGSQAGPQEVGGGGGGSGPTFTGGGGGPRFNIPGVPKFTAPKFTAPDPFAPPGAFKAPTSFTAPKYNLPGQEEVLNDPGYKFRESRGQKALEASAAARGTLNTGGTLKGIVEYGQNLASQEYGNAVNRSLQKYDRDYQGAVDEYDRLYRAGLEEYNLGYRSEFDKYNLGYKAKLDEFDRLYAGRKDEYAPLLAEWQMKSTASMRQAELAWQREWDRYLAELEKWKHLTPSGGDILRAGAD